jgi:hypothetical protein
MRATLAERLGLVTAAEGERLDPTSGLRFEGEIVVTLDAPVERALRRAGVPTGCAARARPRGDGRKACLKRWQRREQRLPRRGCSSRHPAGHTLRMAWEVRALRAGGERCT